MNLIIHYFYENIVVFLTILNYYSLTICVINVYNLRGGVVKCAFGIIFIKLFFLNLLKIKL